MKYPNTVYSVIFEQNYFSNNFEQWDLFENKLFKIYFNSNLQSNKLSKLMNQSDLEIGIKNHS